MRTALSRRHILVHEQKPDTRLAGVPYETQVAAGTVFGRDALKVQPRWCGLIVAPRSETIIHKPVVPALRRGR
jgi:hypothetical protein